MKEDWYWYALENAATLVEAIMVIVILQQFFESKYKKIWPYLVSVISIFGLVTLANSGQIPMYYTVIIYTCTGVVAGFLLYKGTVVSRFLVPILLMVLVIVAEVLTMGILKIAFNNLDEQFIEETPFRMLGIIISKVSLIALVFIAGRFSKKEYTKVPMVYSLSLLCVPVISIISMVTLIQYVLMDVESVLSPVWFALSATGLMFVNLLIIYLFRAIMNYSQSQSRYQLMIQQAEMLSSHLQETNALQEETHRIWHDMKNHFTVIQWMVKSKNYDKLDQYMLTLNETVTNSMLAIQSGNPILDALLNPKAAEAKKFGIELVVNACIPRNISIEDIDLNIVFSNALDNAIEACKKLPQGIDRFITIDSYVKNDHLVLVMKNPFDGIVKRAGEELKTTKMDSGRHGIGMGNMKRVIEKHDGHITTDIEDNMFILSIIMYCQIYNEKAG